MAFANITDSAFAKSIKWETAGIDPNWVGHVYETEDGIPIVTFKDEYFAEVTQATRKMLLDSGIMSANQIDPHVPKLQKEQLDILSKRYNPKNMDSKEYNAFIEDLIQLGIISSKEQKYLLFADTLPNPGGIAIVPETFMEPPYDFDSCHGNVYELSRFYSQLEWCAPSSYKHYQSAQSLSFSKLLNVFNQMGIR